MKSLLYGMSALMLLGGAAIYAADAIPAEGTKAPGFTLKSQEGKEVSLKDYRGKWVVLYFYPKDMTPGCTIEAHNFQRDQPEFDKKKAVILGVSLDTVDSHVKFCTKENLTFKLLSDPEHMVVDKYGSLTHFGTHDSGRAQHVPDRSEGHDPQGLPQSGSESPQQRRPGGARRAAKEERLAPGFGGGKIEAECPPSSPPGRKPSKVLQCRTCRPCCAWRDA